MGKIFKKIAKFVGPILSLIPGLNFVGMALIVASKANETISARKQQKSAKKALEAQASSQSFMVRQPIVSRRIVYGRTRIGGIWFFVDSSSDNKHLYLALGLCDGPIQAIDEIYFDDQLVTLDGNGDGTGKWSGKVTIKKHLGTTSQTVDTMLDGASTEWTSSHTLKGIAYLAVKLTFDPSVYPNGLPNISAVVTGRNDVVDGRDDSTGYTTNPALCLAHYLQLETLGPNVDWTNEIDHTAFDTAAGDCEDQITLSAAGTFTVTTGSDANQIDATGHGLHDSQIVHFTSTTTLPAGLAVDTDYFVVNAEADSFEVSTTMDGSPVTMTNNGTGTHSFTAKEYRYTFNGMIDLSMSPEEIIRQFRDAMAGTVAYIGGKWTMTAGVYQTPTFTITEDMLIGPIKFTPRRSKRTRFNTVKGFFVCARNRFQPTDYPPVTNSTYQTNDGEELIQGFDLPATNTPSMANRIAKILLEKARKERTLELSCNIEALRAQAGKTVLVDLSRYNVSNQPFDVDNFNFEVTGGEVSIPLQLSETASSVYDWTAGSDEQDFDIVEEPVLSDGIPQMPTGLTVTNNVTGRELVEAFMQWDATTDEFILQGGLVVVEWKKSSAGNTEWTSITGSPASIEYPVSNLEPDTNYDFRVAWRNKFGGQSDWATESGHQTASGTSSAFNYKHTQVAVSDEWVITHNLGYRPSVGAIFDNNGESVLADESVGSDSDPTGKTEIKITFTNAFYGTAYLS